METAGEQDGKGSDTTSKRFGRPESNSNEDSEDEEESKSKII